MATAYTRTEENLVIKTGKLSPEKGNVCNEGRRILTAACIYLQSFLHLKCFAGSVHLLKPTNRNPPTQR